MTKPPLFHWLSYAVSTFRGRAGLASVRLVSAWASVGAVLLTYVLGRQLADARVAWWAALLTLSNLSLLAHGHRGTFATLLTFLVCLTLCQRDRQSVVAGEPRVPPRRKHRSRRLTRLIAPLSYSLLLGACFVLRHLPRQWVLAVGAWAGLCCYHLRVRRGVVEKNMEYIGLCAPSQRRALIRRLYRTMGRYVADFLAFDERRPPPVHCQPCEALDRLRANADGRLLVSAHFGNWELLGGEIRKLVPQLVVVARPLRNPWVNRWLTRRRERAGVQLILPRDALRQTLRVIQGGGCVAYLIDQYPGRRGTPAPFLGKTALTVRSGAGVATLAGVQTVAGYALLEADGSYRVTLEDVPPAQGERQEAIIQHLATHNQIVSRWIEAQPEHWFGWFHRRFKDTVRY